LISSPIHLSVFAFFFLWVVWSVLVSDVVVPSFLPPQPPINSWRPHFSLGYGTNSAMREHYMLDGEGFLLVYSITERDTFNVIGAYHQQILRVKDSDTIPVIVVGNKSDLEHERRVATVGASNFFFDVGGAGAGSSRTAFVIITCCLFLCVCAVRACVLMIISLHRRPTHRARARVSFLRDVGQAGNQRDGDVHRPRL
jgi:hypothetical protein